MVKALDHVQKPRKQRALADGAELPSKSKSPKNHRKVHQPILRRMPSDDQAKQLSQSATVKKPGNRNSARKTPVELSERPKRILADPALKGKIRIWKDYTGDRSPRFFSKRRLKSYQAPYG